MSAKEFLAKLKADKKQDGVVWNNKTVIPRLHSGSYQLDAVLGGGYPLGRIIEIIGPTSSGKTTLCYHAIASAQQAGMLVVFLDVEGTFDPTYFSAIGDVDSLEVAKTETGEAALNIALGVVSEPNTLCVVDSVAALLPEDEDEKDIGENSMCLLARLMSQTMRKITAHLHRESLLIFVNQIREKPNVMYGSPETTPGGRALPYHASVRMDVRRIGQVPNGNKVKVKTVKSKVAPPFQECELDLIFGKGIDRGSDLLDHLVAKGDVVRGGAWFTLGDKKAQGREAAIQMVMESDL